MKKQAKLLALILAFCLSTAGLTACDSSTTTSDGAEISAQTEASASGAEAAATSGEAENLPAQTLDVFDPAYMPSTGTPEPDGLTYREVMNFLKLINERHNIIGLDVVELCPNETNKAPDFLASKLIYQILMKC